VAYFSLINVGSGFHCLRSLSFHWAQITASTYTIPGAGGAGGCPKLPNPDPKAGAVGALGFGWAGCPNPEPNAGAAGALGLAAAGWPKAV